jgi:hypothetical protein
MGFDPRSWERAPQRHPPRVTCNVEALLADNDALRREVASLRRQLHQALSQAQELIPPEQGERWGQILARQPAWRELRLGASIRTGAGVSLTGLRGLVEELRRQGRDPHPPLGSLGPALERALQGPPSKVRLAVRAAFALYGPSAGDWLEEEPARVVAELLRHITRREAAQARQRAEQQARSEPASGQDPGRDPDQAEALRTLGLAWGASRDAVKQAHRRLANRHHPDLGGDASTFLRIQAAYRRLCA